MQPLRFVPASWPLGGPEEDVAGCEASECESAARNLRFQNNPRSTIITRTLENAGLRPTRRADFNILWQKKFPNAFQLRQLAPHVRVNHIPGMNLITYKHELVQTLRAAAARASKASPEAVAKEAEAIDALKTAVTYLPQTWLLPTEFESLKAEWDGHSPLIVKRGVSARGEGIELTVELPDVQRVAKDAASSATTSICSKYIERPFIVNGRKFDLRIYVCVLSIIPLRAYVHREILARFCVSTYKEGAETLHDRARHLTNYSINKLELEPEPESEASSQPMHDMSTALKWRLPTLVSYLTTSLAEGGAGLSEVDWIACWSEIRKLLSSVIRASCGPVRRA